MENFHDLKCTQSNIFNIIPCRTETLKLFFPCVINKWNKLDPNNASI